jgi:hypothetical protein
MPTREALEHLKSAEERMNVATEAHRAFLERPDRDYSPEERAENRRLLDNIQRTIDEYWEAFNRAARS